MSNSVHTLADIDVFRESFFSLIEKGRSIVITAHISPDDDSIASVLSVYTILSQKYPEKKIQILYTGQVVDRYNIFLNFNKINFVDDIANNLEGVDTLVLLDGNKYSRSSNFPENLSKVSSRICIDHHGSTPDEFTVALIDTTFTSNSEIIFNVLRAEEYLNKEIAELFLLGILGDTGNLTHIDRNQTQVFSIVKKLLEVSNVRIDSFLSRYRTIPKRIMPLLQEFVRNTTYAEILGWPSFQYSFVEREFVEVNNYSDEDISAASHIYLSQYLPRIENQSWGVVFSPRSDGGVRVSSRSILGSVNVRVLNESIGIGGGHDRASGGNFKSVGGSPVAVSDCIEKVLGFMKNNKPVLS